jgi:DNA-binding transcriptional regulator WhiA
MIHYLQENNLFDDLNDNTKLLAKERLNNPEALLLELADILDENYNLEFSKSGINHLFREIKKKVP